MIEQTPGQALMAQEPALAAGMRVRRVQLGWRGTVHRVDRPQGQECYTFAVVDWDQPHHVRRTRLWVGDLEVLSDG